MKLIPSVEWIKNYDKKWLSGDISAGLTVGVMLIPQGMAYSMLAGLPPIYGLYAVTIPLIIYALLGTSRQLAVGPVAMVSLLIASGVGQLSEAGSDEYIALSILLAFLVGSIQLSMGVFRLGFLVNFLSHPVIAGFTSSAAIIIGFSQFKHLLGVKISGEKFSEIFMQLIKEAGNIHIPTLIIGAASVILLLLVKRVNKKIPGPLVVVLLGIIVVYLGSLTNQGVKIVGDIPGGLPSFHIFSMNWDSIQTLLPTAFTIAFVGFMESIAVAKAIQARHKDYKLDANQELKALGIANIAGSFFKSFPVTGGFSRTAVNDQAGAKTGFASIISASLIIITLLFLTSYFYYLPNAVLAAIIIVAVYGLIDFKEARYLWKTDRTDFFLFISAAIGTLVLGIEEGIILGVILSLALLIFRVSYPHYSQLGLINNGREFINVLRDKNAKIDNKIVIMRFDAQLFFANINYFKEKVELLIGERKQPEFFILDARPVSTVDSTAIHALHELIDELKSNGITFMIANVIGPVRDKLGSSGITDQIGKEKCFSSLFDAYQFATDQLAKSTGK
ncbi:MAG: solute carrier family 26 protein [Saprospiraceae bacterium]|nr:solute carrier family 26 protein [Saprospiraceae bacterium]MBP6567130.1 solute carrier family 26 protein [Saprospiraceae bacterium]